MANRVIVLAAGQGKRMNSDLTKVLQPLAGRPLLAHVLDTCDALEADTTVVFGHGGDAVKTAFADRGVSWAHQAQQLGTGHAVGCAMDRVEDGDAVLVLCGDVPLLRAETVRPLLDRAADDQVAVLTVELDDPSGYGRILRDDGGAVTGIVEQRDASDEQLAVREINSGIIAAPAGRLRAWLQRLSSDNAQGEYYLTDVISMAAGEGVAVSGIRCEDPEEVAGINDRVQLAAAERAYRRRSAEALMHAGATLADPARIDVRGSLTCGRDVFIDVNVVFEGEVALGDGVTIGAGCVIRDCRIGAGTRIRPMSMLERSDVGAGCSVGPFARIRPDSRLGDGSRVGNFVELKKASLGEGAKVNHLSYVGDAEVGADANVGAGTVTCNYDGANKHRTVIGDGAFIGSGSMLVAPITVGEGATIGAGSVITKDAPAGELTVSRPRQMTVPGWRRPAGDD